MFDVQLGTAIDVHRRRPAGSERSSFGDAISNWVVRPPDALNQAQLCGHPLLRRLSPNDALLTWALDSPFTARTSYIQVCRRCVLSSVASSKAAIDGHPKAAIKPRRSGQGFLLLQSVLKQQRFRISGLECDWPERRIGQRWEATRAPTQGPRPKRGVARCPIWYEQPKNFGIGTKR